MNRAVIAVLWLAGTTVPLLTAVLTFGCCALPFHGLIHAYTKPFCHMTATAHDDPQTPAPARERQEPAKRLFTEVPPAFALISKDAPRLATPTAPVAYRSFITLGATRCDRDVGLHVVLATFLI